jgi:Xylose isomerase-like TIM barrel
MQWSSCTALAMAVEPTLAEDGPPKSLDGVIGLTTGSLTHQFDKGVLNAMTLPRFFRDDLGMSMIDFNTRWLTSYEASYLDEVRGAAKDAGCFFSLLKVNHPFGKHDDLDFEKRKETMASAKKMIDTARTLGARWVRFPFSNSILLPQSIECVAAKELAKYGIERDVRMVIENNGWMKSDADSVQKIVAAIGHDLAAPAPDTGNWDDNARYEGLTKSFPNAVTCDFKVWELDPSGEHSRYDLRRCFEIGWRSNFRGPWAIEHWNDDLNEFGKETVLIRNKLEAWIKEFRT